MEIPDRDERDEEAALLLLLLLERQHAALLAVLGDPPDPENVPDDFWTQFDDDLEEALTAILLLVFIQSAAHHAGSALTAEAMQAGLAWSADHAGRVAGQVTATSREMLADAEDADAVTAIFSDGRAARIGVDAVTAAQTQGGEWAVSRFFKLSPHDTWQTVGDDRVCPICEPLDGQPRSDWESGFPDGPPAHPMCRCVLHYDSLNGDPSP